MTSIIQVLCKWVGKWAAGGIVCKWIGKLRINKPSANELWPRTRVTCHDMHVAASYTVATFSNFFYFCSFISIWRRCVIVSGGWWKAAVAKQKPHTQVCRCVARCVAFKVKSSASMTSSLAAPFYMLIRGRGYDVILSHSTHFRLIYANLWIIQWILWKCFTRAWYGKFEIID